MGRALLNLAGDPGAPAILAPGRAPLDHRGLRRIIADTGARLRQLGVGPSDVVALALPPGPEAASAILGVATHAVAAPLDPTGSGEALRSCFAGLGARAMVVDPRHESPARRTAAECGLPVLDLRADDDGPVGRFELRGRPLAPAPPDRSEVAADVALLLHTSGTTAQPKLVPLTASALRLSADSTVAALELCPADRGLLTMPLFHVHGLVAGLLAPLRAGGSVVVSPDPDPEATLDRMAALEITWYTAVPTLHRALLDAARRPGTRLPRLRAMRSSSAGLPPDLRQGLERTFDASVVEAYGMTETCNQVTSNTLSSASRKPGSAGRATVAQVAIMAPDGRLLPAGETGEVVVRGPTVTTGYLGVANDAATFVEGWLRSGDEGRLDADGDLFVTGRLSETINRGGHKIAPREVDETLLAHPEVRQAAAFALPHPTLGEDLAAAVVLLPGATSTAEGLRAFAFERLAGHKVPSAVILANALPTGATGKPQRHRLAQRFAEAGTADFAPPASPLEILIAETAADSLDLDTLGRPLGRHDNLFLRGADSLRGMRLAARLSSLFRLELPATLVFRHPSVRELATRIGTLADASRLAELEAMVRDIELLSDEEAGRRAGR